MSGETGYEERILPSKIYSATHRELPMAILRCSTSPTTKNTHKKPVMFLSICPSACLSPCFPYLHPLYNHWYFKLTIQHNCSPRWNLSWSCHWRPAACVSHYACVRELQRGARLPPLPAYSAVCVSLPNVLGVGWGGGGG